jgi:hypothetical protein
MGEEEMKNERKNYKVIYWIMKGISASDLRLLCLMYGGEKYKAPDGEVDWAKEATILMAKSDGLTDEEITKHVKL